MVIDRANRFMSLKAHPSFNDLFALSTEIVAVAEAALTTFQGWDKDELVARAIAFRAAKKFHEQLFVKMATAIQEGVAEAMRMKNEDPAVFNDRHAADMADDLMIKVLEKETEVNEMRVPGSY